MVSSCIASRIALPAVLGYFFISWGCTSPNPTFSGIVVPGDDAGALEGAPTVPGQPPANPSPGEPPPGEPPPGEPPPGEPPPGEPPPGEPSPGEPVEPEEPEEPGEPGPDPTEPPPDPNTPPGCDGWAGWSCKVVLGGCEATCGEQKLRCNLAMLGCRCGEGPKAKICKLPKWYIPTSACDACQNALEGDCCAP